MKLLCGQMLGSLATWLRFMGFDTFYATDQMGDDELMQIAKDEDRFLITQDKELIFRARKRDILVISIYSTDLDEQLRSVISKMVVDIEQILSRCSLCNNHIIPIKKEEIKKRVPVKAYQNQSQFWLCHQCNKIYWRGSHCDQILKKILSFQK